MSKINLSTANGRKLNRHYIPSVTLTTSDVGSLQPVNIIECNAGDHIDISMSQFSQSQPTAVRTFGSFDLKTYAFFVPMKTFWHRFEDWLSRSADASLEASEAPNIGLMQIYADLFGFTGFDNEQDLYDWGPTDYCKVESIALSSNWTYTFIENAYGHIYDALIIMNPYDSPSDTVLFGIKLNAKGRLLMKIFRGLGYEIPMRADFAGYVPSGGVANAKLHPFESVQWNAGPLLAFARVFYDYIYPSSYVQQQGFGFIFDKTSWDFYEEDLLAKLLKIFFVPMSQDFFNSLWLRMNSKTPGADRLLDPVPVGYGGNSSMFAFANELSTGLQNSSSSDPLNITSYGLRWLESMSDYVIRNQIGGTRFHEWMKSHFGWVSSEQDDNRSVFLKSFSSSLNFSQVVAQSGTDSQLLGQTAAIGQSNGNGRLKFEAKQHGYIIFVHMVVPQSAYYQGVKPWCKRLGSQFDFYTPELDSVGMEPVPRSEVFMSYDRMQDIDIAPPKNLNAAFGFSPRYADRFKRGNSFLNGDFRLSSRNADLDAYHTFRNVLYNRKNLALDAQFMEADNQYNRIFAYPLTASDDVQRDHIESMFIFDIKRYSTASSIGDSMPIFNRSGRDVSLDNGGTQLN